jgi:NAD-dependent DNA ligase
MIYHKNINMLVPYYLMYSYAYYKEGESLIEDAEFDQMCKDLLDNWDKIEHYHKHLIDLDSLRAGTGYAIQYPKRVQFAAIALIKDHHMGERSEMD